MSVKVIEIDFSKCPAFKNTLLEVASYADIVHKIEPTKKGMAGYKKYITKVITSGLKLYDEYSIELFGKVIYEDDEEQQKEYLSSMI